MEITTVVIRNEDDDTWTEAFLGHVDKEAAILSVKQKMVREFEQDPGFPFTDNVSTMGFVEEFYTFTAYHVVGSTLEA